MLQSARGIVATAVNTARQLATTAVSDMLRASRKGDSHRGPPGNLVHINNHQDVQVRAPHQDLVRLR